MNCFKRGNMPIQGNSQDYVRKVVPNVFSRDKIPVHQRDYIGNKISTTRYNLFTYIPVSMFIQFIRVTNIFYVINAIL